MAPCGMIAVTWGLSIFQAASAWLPLTRPNVQHRPPSTIMARGCPSQQQQLPLQLRATAGDDRGGGGGGRRPDLKSMKRSFEISMDNKLIMEYVMELRARKALLLSSLEETRGVITDDIYAIMEELALVNPSSGCGAGSDKGRSHYCAMLPGHWIAASTIVPNVPYVYGPGEKRGGSSSRSGGGDGPTCTLGELVSAISGRKAGSDGTEGTTAAAAEYNASTPVRPLRARISALTNTVKEGEMPTVVTVAGFSHAAESTQVVAAAAETNGSESGCHGGGGDRDKDPEDAKAKTLAAALVEAAAKGGRAASDAGGSGFRAGTAADAAPMGAAPVASTADDGAVRGRGKWGVMGGYHLRWEFETMNVDLGRDRIVKAAGGDGRSGGDGGGRDLYEFFLDQNMLIVAWKDAPKKEDAVVFVRDEVRR